MKKFLLLILTLISLTASAQHNYPRYFQNINRANTNRFTVGAQLPYRWQAFIDSTTSDTIRITPSCYENIYSFQGGPGGADSVGTHHILLNNGNTYLNDKIIITGYVATGDTIYFPDQGFFGSLYYTGSFFYGIFLWNGVAWENWLQ